MGIKKVSVLSILTQVCACRCSSPSSVLEVNSSARGAGTALSCAIKLGFMSMAMNEGKLTVSSVLYFPTCSFRSIDFGSGVFLVFHSICQVS